MLEIFKANVVGMSALTSDINLNIATD